MELGLVLEGGAMRGMYTAGVLDVFLDREIKVDRIVGVSAGALFGVNYLSGQRGRVIRYNRRFNGDKNYMGLLPLLKEGNIVGTKYAYEDVPRRLDPFDDMRYRESGVPFYAVVTDVKTGEPDYIRIHSVFDQMDFLRASGSMPFVSRPVKVGGREFLDGGISDGVPFRWLSAQGCKKLIVILTRDMEYRKKPMPRTLTNLYRRRYPEIAKQLQSRHLRYNRTIETLRQWEQEGRAFVIRPSKAIRIKKIEKDPGKLQSVYDLGIHDAESALPLLRKYIDE